MKPQRERQVTTQLRKIHQRHETRHLAFIAAKSLIDRISSRISLTDVAINIGQAIEDEQKFTAFQSKFPHLFTKVVNEASDSRKRKRQNINAAANRYNKEWSGWSKSDKSHVGTKLIDLFIASTGFAEVSSRRIKANRNASSFPVHPYVSSLNRTKISHRCCSPVSANGRRTRAMVVTERWWLSDPLHPTIDAGENEQAQFP